MNRLPPIKRRKNDYISQIGTFASSFDFKVFAILMVFQKLLVNGNESKKIFAMTKKWRSTRKTSQMSEFAIQAMLMLHISRLLMDQPVAN